MMINRSSTATALLAACFAIGHVSTYTSASAAIVFDFEEGAFGTNWFDLTDPADGPNRNLNFSTDSNVLISGSYTLGPAVYAERDDDHLGVLHIRSKAFTLDGSGDLDWTVFGFGQVAPTTGTGAIPTGALGLTLTRVSDGERVLASGTYDARSATTTLSFTQAQLAPFVAESGETWVIDIFDNRTSGGWESLNIDDITVPGTLIPEPSALLLGAMGSLLLLRRRR